MFIVYESILFLLRIFYFIILFYYYIIILFYYYIIILFFILFFYVRIYFSRIYFFSPKLDNWLRSGTCSVVRSAHFDFFFCWFEWLNGGRVFPPCARATRNFFCVCCEPCSSRRRSQRGRNEHREWMESGTRLFIDVIPGAGFKKKSFEWRAGHFDCLMWLSCWWRWFEWAQLKGVKPFWIESALHNDNGASVGIFFVGRWRGFCYA